MSSLGGIALAAACGGADAAPLGTTSTTPNASTTGGSGGATNTSAHGGSGGSGTCVAGAFRCTGSNLETCDAAGAWKQLVACPAPTVCDAALGQCDSCAPGAATCATDSSLRVCAADGHSDQVVPCVAPTPRCAASPQGAHCVACSSPADCPSSGGDCAIPACSAEGDCSAQPLAAGTACGAPGGGRTCDGKGQCVECAPGAASCNGATPLACDANGLWKAKAPCSAPTPVCAAGACVQCAAAVDCPTSANDCLAATCAAATCSFAPVPAGSACGQGGKCDGKGQCTVCSPGTKVCNGNQILTCNPKGQYDPPLVCSGNQPVCDPVTFTCVACVTSAQCPPSANPCMQATCAAGQCGFGPQANGSACSIAGDSGTCAGGVCAVCSAGKARCKPGGGAVPQSCVGGQWVDGAACGGGAPCCVAGQCGSCKTTVLLAGAPFDDAWLSEVQAQQVATAAFAAVDVFNLKVACPSLATLQLYDAVLVFTDAAPVDPVQLGDNLAAYYDAGGHVVLGAFTTAIGAFSIAGKFANPASGYLLLDPEAPEGPADTLGVILEPASPLVSGVSTLAADHAFRSTGAPINGGVVVATWASKNRPLIVRGVVKGRNRVDVNFFPPSASSRPDFWSGDGALIIRNALLYK